MAELYNLILQRNIKKNNEKNIIKKSQNDLSNQIKSKKDKLKLITTNKNLKNIIQPIELEYKNYNNDNNDQKNNKDKFLEKINYEAGQNFGKFEGKQEEVEKYYENDINYLKNKIKLQSENIANKQIKGAITKNTKKLDTIYDNIKNGIIDKKIKVRGGSIEKKKIN